ncbi:hypothetical protein F511_30682 [Dorcoceras hygrometricum]|uniref:Uncharacterized protein n=1 Tax=Dorcoceras hygrometricum TaxID=472368 RepID=A0A2Z7BA65_9LAMI|nr:hypothetical protein F511_30682 [Dorcoceras hygrometricum]
MHPRARRESMGTGSRSNAHRDVRTGRARQARNALRNVHSRCTRGPHDARRDMHAAGTRGPCDARRLRSEPVCHVLSVATVHQILGDLSCIYIEEFYYVYVSSSQHLENISFSYNVPSTVAKPLLFTVAYFFRLPAVNNSYGSKDSGNGFPSLRRFLLYHFRRLWKARRVNVKKLQCVVVRILADWFFCSEGGRSELFGTLVCWGSGSAPRRGRGRTKNKQPGDDQYEKLITVIDIHRGFKTTTLLALVPGSNRSYNNVGSSRSRKNSRIQIPSVHLRLEPSHGRFLAARTRASRLVRPCARRACTGRAATCKTSSRRGGGGCAHKRVRRACTPVHDVKAWVLAVGATPIGMCARGVPDRHATLFATCTRDARAAPTMPAVICTRQARVALAMHVAYALSVLMCDVVW